MIGVFDELENINSFIRYGFKYSKQWSLDMGLFVRWKKADWIKDGEKPTKKKMREILIKKCNQSLSWFDEDDYISKINSVINKNWNIEFNPISIKKIEIPKVIIEWFVSQYQDKKVNKNELKFLFTLYVGYLIKQIFNFKETNLLKYYKDGDKVFLKENSNMQQSISIRKMMYQLFDKQYIYINLDGRSFICNFIKDEEIFNTTNISEECINLSTSDLYECGNWIWTYMTLHKYCNNCGKLIEDSNNRKYCIDCAKTIYRYKKEPEIVKYIKCIDCNKGFVVDSHSNDNVRCEECSRKNKLEIDRQKIKEQYIPQDNKKLICKSCGKEFILSSKGQRELCDECYNKKTQTNQSKTITCTKCRKSFKIGSKSKRNICDECYKEYRKQQIKKAKERWIRNQES